MAISHHWESSFSRPTFDQHENTWPICRLVMNCECSLPVFIPARPVYKCLSHTGCILSLPVTHNTTGNTWNNALFTNWKRRWTTVPLKINRSIPGFLRFKARAIHSSKKILVFSYSFYDFFCQSAEFNLAFLCRNCTWLSELVADCFQMLVDFENLCKWAFWMLLCGFELPKVLLK